MPDSPRELVNPRGSLIRVNIAGKTYDARRVPNCKTCNHPFRIEIEKKILSGVPYRAIAEQYSEVEYTEHGETRTAPSLHMTAVHRHHKEQHMPVEAAVLREITDRHAQALSEHYEEETQRIVNGIELAEQVTVLVQLGLADGSLKPTVADGLNAAKLLVAAKSDQDEPVDAEVWDRAMGVFFEKAREIMTDAQWQAFGAALNASPVLAALRKRQEAQPMEAEIVEETL